MTDIILELEGDGVWKDLIDRKVHHHTTCRVSGLERGMNSGKPSVAIRIDLEGRQSVVVETSLALFLTVADALKARFGDPR